MPAVSDWRPSERWWCGEKTLKTHKKVFKSGQFDNINCQINWLLFGVISVTFEKNSPNHSVEATVKVCTQIFVQHSSQRIVTNYFQE